ncbi:MAG: hypothetical protein WEC15_07305 [Flavobacteriales bacterium]
MKTRSMRAIVLPAFLLLLVAGCDTSNTKEQAVSNTTDQGSAPAGPHSPMLATSDRDSWQRPHELMQMIGPDIKGMIIADLFADDGYFTFKLIEAGANVIAIENDPAKVAALEQRKKELGLSDERLRIRAVPVGDPGIANAEADVALITHRYTGIQNKASYISRLRQGLLPPRPLFIIEWQHRETPVGPPLAERMPTENIMDEVGELGYSDIGAHSAKMPYQVIFLATDYMELDDDTYNTMMEGVEIVPQ